MASFRTPGVAVVTGAGAQAAAEASSKFASNSDFKSKGVKLDVTNASHVAEMFEAVVKEFGRIDYLVNSAGIDVTSYTPIPDDDVEDFDKVLAVNTKGILLCTRGAVRYMEKQEPLKYTSKTGWERTLGRGCVVNVTSVLSYAAVPGKVGYISWKHASIGVTKATAQDTADKGIRVNAVCPGWVRTPMFEGECKKFPPAPDFVKAAVPLGRLAEPEEVGEAIVFMCSPAASYINGIGLVQDAGLTLTVHLGV